MNWEAIYTSDWQAVWALWIAPLLFLGFRIVHGPLRTGADPTLAKWVDVYCLVFAAETLIDPLCTTLVPRWLGGSSGVAAAFGVLFVWLGDFRVLLLAMAFALRSGARESTVGWRSVSLRAAGWAALVPAVAYGVFRAAEVARGDALEGRWLYLAHECLFLGLALGLRRVLLARTDDLGRPAAALVSATLVYSAVYYGLWASADLLLLAGYDLGFALRILPNQLYYAFWIPFVWWRFRVG